MFHVYGTSRKVSPLASHNYPDMFPDSEFYQTQESSSHDLQTQNYQKIIINEQVVEKGIEVNNLKAGKRYFF